MNLLTRVTDFRLLQHIFAYIMVHKNVVVYIFNCCLTNLTRFFYNVVFVLIVNEIQP